MLALIFFPSSDLGQCFREQSNPNKFNQYRLYGALVNKRDIAIQIFIHLLAIVMQCEGVFLLKHYKPCILSAN